jgi:hypothetical protein
MLQAFHASNMHLVSIAFTITSFVVIALNSGATAASIRIATTCPARRTFLSAGAPEIFSALYKSTGCAPTNDRPCARLRIMSLSPAGG